MSSGLESPLDALKRLTSALVTGEYVLATGSSEVHVYLQRGRFAWATDSQHPHEFLRHLKQHRRLDDPSLREVIEACRRERRPLGETLVQWNLATLEEVRASLRHQVLVSVRTAARATSGAALFLERPQFRDYDERLTFGFAELLEALGPVSSPSPLPSAPPDPGEHEPLAPRIFTASPGVTNVCVFRAGARVEDTPPGAGALRPTPSLADFVTASGCDFAAVRTDTGSLVGARLGDGALAFASVGASNHYGQTLTALRWAGWASPHHHRGRERHEPPPWLLGAQTMPGGVEVLGWDREMLAVAIVDARGRLMQVIGRASITQQEVLRWVDARLVPFAALSGDVGGEGGRHVGLGDSQAWGFAARFGAGLTTCLIVHRRSQQGLGWAGLNAQLRLLRVNTRGGA